MPIGYMIGKGLTALFGKKGKKEQQAEELEEVEKEDTPEKGEEIVSKEDPAEAFKTNGGVIS